MGASLRVAQSRTNVLKLKHPAAGLQPPTCQLRYLLVQLSPSMKPKLLLIATLEEKLHVLSKKAAWPREAKLLPECIGVKVLISQIICSETPSSLGSRASIWLREAVEVYSSL